MRMVIFLLFTVVYISCNKSIAVKFPAYESQIAVEMYLEDNTPLKGFVSASLSYSTDTITEMIGAATVIFSDGVHADTLQNANVYDYESGRICNYSSSRIFYGDSTRTYTLEVIDSLGNRVIASTRMPGAAIRIDTLVCSASGNQFSAGISFKDPPNVSNYYRVIIGKGINNYEASNTDIVFSDDAFDGQTYSFNSKAGYEKGDTVTVRLYTLLKNHYDYLKSVQGAQTATVNPFVQPVRAVSNVEGGQGIFTAIRYDERKIVIR